jgi:transcriptional regulator of arginine metabolism
MLYCIVFNRDFKKMTTTIQLLKNILIAGKARTQIEIQKELQQHGVQTSQPQISRLLHQIGAVKLIDSEGKTQYRLPNEAGLLHELFTPQEKSIFHHWILGIEANETLIVIHTTPGAAGMIARIIDMHRTRLNVLGTIAGDDTIFITPQAHQRLKDIQANIQQLLEYV